VPRQRLTPNDLSIDLLPPTPGSCSVRIREIVFLPEWHLCKEAAGRVMSRKQPPLVGGTHPSFVILLTRDSDRLWLLSLPCLVGVLYSPHFQAVGHSKVRFGQIYLPFRVFSLSWCRRGVGSVWVGPRLGKSGCVHEWWLARGIGNMQPMS